MRVISMSDQIFDAFGDRIVSGRPSLQAEPTAASRFLTRFGVTVFWLLAILIISARIFVGV